MISVPLTVCRKSFGAHQHRCHHELPSKLFYFQSCPTVFATEWFVHLQPCWNKKPELLLFTLISHIPSPMSDILSSSRRCSESARGDQDEAVDELPEARKSWFTSRPCDSQFVWHILPPCFRACDRQRTAASSCFQVLDCTVTHYCQQFHCNVCENNLSEFTRQRLLLRHRPASCQPTWHCRPLPHAWPLPFKEQESFFIFYYSFNGISTSCSAPLSTVTMTLLIACRQRD